MTARVPAQVRADFEAWKARRAECLRIGHDFVGETCKQCGAAKHGNAKHQRPKGETR